MIFLAKYLIQNLTLVRQVSCVNSGLVLAVCLFVCLFVLWTGIRSLTHSPRVLVHLLRLNLPGCGAVVYYYRILFSLVQIQILKFQFPTLDQSRTLNLVYTPTTHPPTTQTFGPVPVYMTKTHHVNLVQLYKII